MSFFCVCIHSIFFFLILSVLPIEAKELKQVLVIYSQDKWHPAHELTEKGMLSVFTVNEKYNINLHVEYLELGFLSKPEQQQIVADFLLKKYASIKIDAIITVYATALNFIIKDGKSIFPGIPIIASELPQSPIKLLDGSPMRRFITGTTGGESISNLLEDIVRIRPGTKYIVLVGGTSAIDVYNENHFRRGLESLAGKIEIIDFTKLPLDNILDRIGTLPPESVVLYSTMFQDSAGNDYVPREVVTRLSSAANVPVFGLYDTYMDYGIVGGRLASFEEHGKETARLTLRVLDGEEPGAIPWGGVNAYIDAYDWRELQRWHIPLSLVPAGSDLRNYNPSYWESHKWIVFGICLIILIESMLIFGLVINIRSRRQYERSFRESEERVRVAVDASGAGLWNLNIDSGKVWATARARELFGFGTEEALYLDTIVNIIHPEDRKAVIRSIQQSCENGDDTDIEYRLILPDNSIRWVAIRGKVFLDKTNIHLLKGACIDITASKQAEIDLRQHEQELTELTGRLISSQEEELQRLSRELHDDLTQRLAAIVMDLGFLGKTLQQQEAVAIIRDIKNRVSEASIEVHQLSRRLHPAILNDLGLTRAIKDECDAFRKRTGIDLSCSIDAPATFLPFPVELCLYRVLQEGLQNLAKHSQTNKAHVSLQSEQKAIMLSIQDFGIGFNPNQARGCGIGFSCMKERVRFVKGHCAIVSTQGEGTRIKVTIPLTGDCDVKTADIASR